MRLLQGAQDHRHVVVLVILAVEVQLVRCEALQHELKSLVIHLGGLLEIDAVEFRLEVRDAAAKPKLETSAAQMIEHADLFDQP